MPVLDVFGLEFANYLAIFEIGTLKYFCLQNFPKKQKCPNLAPEMPFFDIFELEFGNNLSIFETGTLKFVCLQNFTEQ